MTTTPHFPRHLQPEHWARATRWLVRKALAEFAHERMLEPSPLDAEGMPSARVPARHTSSRLASFRSTTGSSHRSRS